MKRKNYILFLAAGVMAAALSLNSCDNRMGADVSDEFTFSATAVSYTGRVGTKAAPINTVDAFESTYTSFKVSAYNGATAKFTDKTSSYSAGEWNLNTTAKWYPNETLDFFAVAPADGATLSITPASGTTGASASFTYTASAGDDALISGSEVPDLMFGYYTGQGVLNTAGSKRVAPLTFYHPFAAIRFVAGDIAGATVNSIKIKNAAYSGTCTINYASLATAGSTAISWVNVNSLADYGNTYTSVTAVEDEQIGTDAQTLMLLPQTLGGTAKLEVSLTVTDEGVESDVTLEASLKDVVLEAGKILTFKINYADIPISIMEPEGMIIPYIPTAAVHINDPQLVPKYAYLPTGTVFNADLTALAAGRPITKITFNRFGSVDDTTPDTDQIQEAENENHPEGEIIYAHYDNGEITITTHANTIYLNADCSEMFKDMAQLTEIQWGNFFESEALSNTMGMFWGCSSLQLINLSGVLNTTLVTDMSHMFDGCSSATHINCGLAFITSNVTDMSYMFRNCSAMTILDKGNNFATRNVTDMSYMYYNCHSLNSIQLASLASVQHMDYMFYNCYLPTFVHFNNVALPDPLPISADHMLYNAVAPGGTYVMIRPSVYSWLQTHNTDLDPSITPIFTDE